MKMKALSHIIKYLPCFLVNFQAAIYKKLLWTKCSKPTTIYIIKRFHLHYRVLALLQRILLIGINFNQGTCRKKFFFFVLSPEIKFLFVMTCIFGRNLGYVMFRHFRAKWKVQAINAQENLFAKLKAGIFIIYHNAISTPQTHCRFCV